MPARNFRPVPQDEAARMYYSGETIDALSNVLDDARNELRARRTAPLTAEEDHLLGLRLARAIFKVADAGETDAARLKQSAIAAAL